MIERKDKRYVSCPVCGRILMKCQGMCNIDITCGKCNKEIVIIIFQLNIQISMINQKKTVLLHFYFSYKAVKKSLDRLFMHSHAAETDCKSVMKHYIHSIKKVYLYNYIIYLYFLACALIQFL